MPLLSGFLSGYFPPLLRPTSQHSCCRNIRHSENRWGDFFFSPSCEKYWDCNLRTGNFQLGCGIRGVSVLVPPSQSASSMSLAVGPSSRAVPVKSRDDCRGFVWFNGERLFSTLNRFMAFPTDWYPQSSRQAFNTSHRHKSNWKRSKDWLSVTTDPHTVIEPTPLMNIGWAEGVVVQVWARPRGVVCVCVCVCILVDLSLWGPILDVGCEEILFSLAVNFEWRVWWHYNGWGVNNLQSKSLSNCQTASKRPFWLLIWGNLEH